MIVVVGGTGLRLALHERGLRPVSTAADRPLAVVQGYSPDISYGLLAEAALALNAGAFVSIPLTFTVAHGNTYSFTVTSQLGNSVIFNARAT